MLNTYYYRDMRDVAKGLNGRGWHSDNVIFTLKLRDMLKPTFGINPKVEQIAGNYDRCSAATFNGTNESKGFWVHFSLHTVENNFESMDNGDIEAVVQVLYEFRVNPKLAWATTDYDDKYYPCCVVNRKSFRTVVARRVDNMITIDEDALIRLSISIAKSFERAKWEAKYKLGKQMVTQAIKLGYKAFKRNTTKEVVHG